MKRTNRRNFILKCSFACLGCTPFINLLNGKALDNLQLLVDTDKTIDPKKLNYCGYTCPKDCKVYQASINNDEDLKKEAFKLWKIEERHGIKFDAGNFYCYQCKNTIEPKGVIQEQCTVRHCAIDKGLDCCIECQELRNCKEDLWKRFPDFHESVIKLQVEYKQKNTV
jgi:hypothetical protein